MERIIKVTGKAKIAVAPDTLQLLIDLEGTKPTYNESRELSIECNAQMIRAIVALELDSKALKTRSYSINAAYQSYEDKDKSWKRRFVGYKFSHQTKLEFPIDNALLGQVIEALNSCTIKPDISINYTIADPEPAKNSLLAKAVADSQAKAQELTRAAGVELGNVLTIDYSWGEINIVRNYDMDTKFDSCCDQCIDFTPEDIDLSDTVTVVWSIK